MSLLNDLIVGSFAVLGLAFVARGLFALYKAMRYLARKLAVGFSSAKTPDRFAYSAKLGSVQLPEQPRMHSVFDSVNIQGRPPPILKPIGHCVRCAELNPVRANYCRRCGNTLGWMDFPARNPAVDTTASYDGRNVTVTRTELIPARNLDRDGVFSHLANCYRPTDLALIPKILYPTDPPAFRVHPGDAFFVASDGRCFCGPVGSGTCGTQLGVVFGPVDRDKP